jgi:hypothetical protein
MTSLGARSASHQHQQTCKRARAVICRSAVAVTGGVYIYRRDHDKYNLEILGVLGDERLEIFWQLFSFSMR